MTPDLLFEVVQFCALLRHTLDRMPQEVWVNASTSVVQIDSSQIVSGVPVVVYLSSIFATGSLITIRDIAGQASATKSIIVSTTKDLHFLDGTQVSSYSITQPYGFLTVNPRTSTIWALMNTFAFPDQSAAALVNSINATNATTSTLYSYQVLVSTAAISSISTDTVFVRTNLSVGQSTLANDLYLRSSLTAIGGISTAATLFASTAVTTRSLIASSTIQTPFAQLQFSTGLTLDIAGTTRTAGLISTLGPLYVGGLISTTSDLAVGGSTLVGGQLRVGGYTFLQSSLSTVGSFTLGGAANLTSSLTVTDNAMFLRHASVTSNLTVAGALSVMSSLYVKGDLEVVKGLLLHGLLSTNSSMNVGENMSIAGDLAVGGDLYFNDRLLDLNNLSVIFNLYVGNNISTLSSIAAGQSLQIAGSTLLVGPVSTASTLTVGSHLSTIGNLALGGSAFFASTLTVRAALCTLSNVAVGGTLTVSSTTIHSQGMSTFGQSAFFSSVQIQGGLSVFSSIAVSCNVDVQGTLSAKGFNLGGAAVVNTLGVTQTGAGWGANISSSTLQHGLFSTLGNIDMGGRFSTPNVMAIGSTLFTSFATVANNLSTLVNTNVGGQLNVLGKTVLGDTLTAGSYATFSNGLSTITNTNVGAQLNVLGAATIGGGFSSLSDAIFLTATSTVGRANFGSVYMVGGLTIKAPNGDQTNLDAAATSATFGSVSFAGGKASFNSGGINDLRAPGPVFLGATSTGQLVITSTLSTFCDAAFYSSVQIQGSLSVFSSVTVRGILTADTIQLLKGAIVSTLGITAATPGWGLNISSSTLAYGLISTTGSVNIGGALSTAGAQAVGGNFAVLGTTTGTSATYVTNVTASNSLLTNTVTGSNNVYSASVTGSNNVYTNSVTGSNYVLTTALQASNSITVKTGSTTPTNGFLVDVGGAIRTTGTLALVSASPKITLSTTGVNAYSIYTQPAGNAGENGFTITDSGNVLTRFIIASGGNVGINTNTPAYTFDVNGTAAAATAMTSPSLLANLTTTSSIVVSNVISNGNGTAALPSYTFRAANTVGTYTDGTGLGLATAGTSRLYIASGGNVGIANANPGVTLDVTGTARTSLAFQTTNGTAASPSYTFTNAATVGLYTDGTGLGFVPRAGTLPAIYIHSSGRVGISNTTPNAAYSLDIAGGGLNTTSISIGGILFNPGSVGLELSTSLFKASSIMVSTLTATKTTILTNTETPQVWIAAGSNATSINFFTGTTGSAWTSYTPTQVGLPTVTSAGASVQGISYNGAVWAIVGNSGSGSAATAAFLYTSPNGTTWTAVANPGTTTFPTSQFNAIVWNGSYWLLLGSSTSGAAASTRTILRADPTFTTFSSPIVSPAATTGFINSGNAAAWNGTMWVAVGFDTITSPATTAQNIKYSYDGVNWTNAVSGGFTATVTSVAYAVVWNGILWVAGGGQSSGATEKTLRYSYDGMNWITPSTASLMTIYCRGLAWNGTVFVAVGRGANTILYSYDGITWVPASGQFSLSGYSVSWNGTVFVAGGNGTGGGSMRSPDGITWTAAASGIASTDSIFAVGYSSNVTPDAVIGNTSFYNKQPQFLTSTNSVNMGSNWMTLNNGLKVTTAGAVNMTGSVNIPAYGLSRTLTFSYTGSLQTFTVPTGITQLSVVLNGAGGQPGSYGTGGAGGFVSGTLNVIAGQVLTVIVGGSSGYGGGGTGAAGGGNGGGRSAIQLVSGTDTVTAGGGGGAGYQGSTGGSGGGLSGTSGINSSYPNNSIGGGGGTQSSGGTAGSYDSINIGTAGSLYTGGNGGGGITGCGGGGGGYYGGGGSVVNGAGGGSSYIANLINAITIIGSGAAANTNGSVTITYIVNSLTVGGYTAVSTLTVSGFVQGNLGVNASAPAVCPLYVAGDFATTSTLNVGVYSPATNTAASGACIQWNTINTAAGNVEILAAKGTKTTGAVTFYTGLADSTAATSSDLAFTITKAGCTAAGTMTATSFTGSLTGNVTGNAATASILNTGTAFVNDEWYSTPDTYNRIFFNSSGNTLFQTAPNASFVFRKSDTTTVCSISSAGLVNATSFSGSLTGNVTGNVTGSSGSCTGNAATASRLNAASAFVNDAWYYSADSKLRLNFEANGTTFFGTGNAGNASTDLLYQFKKYLGSLSLFSIYGDGSIKAEGDITAFSDGRYKTNIVTINDALDKVRQMRGVYYHKVDDLVNRKMGVIAQEMEAVIPEVVLTEASEDKKKSVAYGNLTAILIEAVKTLAERLERLEEKLASGQ